MFGKPPAFVERAIALGGDISYTDENWSTLLHHASSSCHPSVVQFFLDNGLSLEAKNKRGSTPLIAAACASCSLKIIKKLLKAGADINAKTSFEESALIMAARNNPRADITRFFIEQGLSLADRDRDGYTPFLNAVIYQENTDVLDALVKAGSDIHERAPNGDTAFHLAAMNRNPEPAEWLKEHFSTSEKNDTGETCLERALSSGSGRTLSVYLKKMQLEHLMLASKNSDYDVFETLVHSGYDLNLKDKNGATVLMHTAIESESWVGIVKMLDLGAFDNIRDKNHRNVLHYAAANSDIMAYEMTSTLLGGHSGELAEDKDVYGHTPDYYCTHKDEF